MDLFPSLVDMLTEGMDLNSECSGIEPIIPGMEKAMTVFLFELSGAITRLHIRVTWKA